MFRGRRRGGPGLSGLKDGVRRRLFDPHSVPTKPDAKYEVSRLAPLRLSLPTVVSRLEVLRKQSTDDAREIQPETSQNSFIKIRALLELAFRAGPFYHPLPIEQEGLEIGHAYVGVHPENQDKEEREKCPISLSHLLLTHQEIKLWGLGKPLNDLDDPDYWYPKELVNLTKRKKRLSKSGKKKNILANRRRSLHVADLQELIPDQLIEEAMNTAEEEDDDVVENPELNARDDEVDPEDARWNCEVNVEFDADEIRQEELDNDYCQTYFDNGEGDGDDDGSLGGDGD